MRRPTARGAGRGVFLAVSAALLSLSASSPLWAASPEPRLEAGERDHAYRARQAFAACGEEAAALTGTARTDKEKQCRRALALSRLMEAPALWKAFADDTLEAEENYVGRLLAVKGVVTGLGTSPMGYPEVVFGLDGFNVKSVRCQFPSTARAAVDALKPGGTVTIGGICKGFVRDTIVSMDSCELLP